MFDSDNYDDRVACLEENGFFIWRGLLDLNDIDAHLSAYESEAVHIDGHFRADKTHLTLPAHREARAKFYEKDRTHDKLCFRPQLLQFLKKRFGSEPVLRIFGTHLYCLGSHIHADCLNGTAADPWEHELRMWCALENVHPSSGPMYLFPRSHRLISGVIREELLAENPAYKDYLINDNKPYTEKAKVFGQLMQDKIEAGTKRFQLEPFMPNLQKGDVLIFNPAIIHGSSQPESPELTRKCMIFNFFAESAPFYQPGAYWGKTHDYRRPENEIHFEMKRYAGGLRVINYLETCRAISERAIMTD